MNRVFVLLLGLTACSRSMESVAPEPPVTGVEFVGSDEAIARLAPGVSARAVAGLDLFSDFDPGLNPLIARTRFGEPQEVLAGEGETLFVYVRDSRRVAVCQHVVKPSDGGPSTFSYSVRAWPGASYAERLPLTLQSLIKRRGGRHSIIVASIEPTDWNVEIHIRDRAVDYVAARTRPDRVSAVETTGSGPR